MKCKCLRCGHEWTARTDDKPISCPRCKRYDWNKWKLTKPNGAERE